MLKETDKIKCVDKEGTVVIVYEYTTFVETTNMSSTSRTWTPGMKEYRTNSGRVMKTGDKTFEDIITHKILTRI